MPHLEDWLPKDRTCLAAPWKPEEAEVRESHSMSTVSGLRGRRRGAGLTADCLPPSAEGRLLLAGFPS